MSKKIAEGIDALVLDVKTGSGAFMKTVADSRRLAESLVSIGNASGVHDRGRHHRDGRAARPRGRAMRSKSSSASKCSKVGGPADLIDVSVELTAPDARARAGARDRSRGGRAPGPRRDRVGRTASSVSGESSSMQGGDPRVIDDYGRLPSAPDRLRRFGCAERAASSPTWTPSPSAARRWCWAPGATRVE